MPRGLGRLQRTDNGMVYFGDFRQVTDPYVTGITPADGTQGRSTLLAITDADGQLRFVNPRPGELGNLAVAQFESPGEVTFDLSVIKRTRLSESRNMEFRAEFFQVLNNPNFGDPVVNINSLNFGRITTATGNRIIQFGLRFNF